MRSITLGAQSHVAVSFEAPEYTADVDAIGTLRILELAQLVAKATGFKGKISTDITKPDWTMRKLMDVGRLSQMGWSARIKLEQGLANTYEWYLANAQPLRT